MLLDRGEELSALTAARVRNASAGLALRLLDDAPGEGVKSGSG